MKKYILIALTVILVVVCGWLISKVVINYDMRKYLPDDHEQTIGVEKHDELYGSTSFAHLLVKDDTLSNMLMLKSELLTVDGVLQIDFMDDVLNELSWGLLLNQVDLDTKILLEGQMTMLMGGGLSFTESFYQIVSNMPESSAFNLTHEISRYESNNTYKMTIQISTETLESETIMDEIRVTLDVKEIDYTLVGGVMSELFVRDAIEQEVLRITLILIPLVLVILLLMTPSFADLFVFIVISGVAIIINLGTNVFFEDISFITQSMAIALQLAISLDYIIFIVHRYHKDRLNLDKDAATKETMKHVKAPVMASALTTGASFLALVFMRFSIGMDVGLVFLKAITLSCISSLVLGPILIKWFDRWMMKSKHPVFVPRFNKFSKLIYKLRYIFLAIFILLIVPSYYFQSQNDFVYGETALVGSSGTAYHDDFEEMVQTFGYDNQIVILTTKDTLKEQALYQFLTTDPSLDINYVRSPVYYQSIITDPLVLSAIEQQFYSGDYQQTIVSLNMEEESESSFEMIAYINQHVDEIAFTEAFVIGTTPAAMSIKDVIEFDYFYVTIIAICLILAVIFFTFKNWILPFILTVVIMTSVFMAMSVPYFLGHTLAFLGYLVVSTILLGATIDYAILFTKRYIELREIHSIHESIEYAIEECAPSITTSALILGIAGLSIGFISSVLAIQQIGLQIALGAFFGLLSVLVLLPQLIFIFDKFIIKAKINRFTSQKK
ncbi:MAG: MMPL family transporter [Acholeplasmataceae bacterium]